MTDDTPSKETAYPEFLDPLQLYKTEIAGFEPLNPEQTRALVIKAKAGDEQARTHLIESLLPVGFWLANRYRKLRTEDVVSIFNQSLMESIDDAIKSYDLDREPSTLLSYVISIAKRKLNDETDRLHTVVTVPRDALIIRRKVRKGLTAGIPARTIETATAVALQDRSLDDPIAQDTKGEEPLTLEETIDSGTPTPEALTAKDEGRAVILDLLRSTLSPRQLEVVSSLYGFNRQDEAQTAQEIADRMNVSLQTVKGVRQESLRKLRRVPQLEPVLRAICTPYRPFGRLGITLPPKSEAEREANKRSGAHMRKLTDSQVRQIRELWESKALNGKQLSEQFKVSRGTISMIVNHKTNKRIK